MPVIVSAQPAPCTTVEKPGIRSLMVRTSSKALPWISSTRATESCLAAPGTVLVQAPALKPSVTKTLPGASDQLAISKPLPPDRTSLPLPPTRTSSPSPQERESLPSAPPSESAPPSSVFGP